MRPLFVKIGAKITFVSHIGHTGMQTNKTSLESITIICFVCLCGINIIVPLEYLLMWWIGEL
jgi:hypothetical protein